jgi:Ca2+-binding EF-hand superfamily protein
VFVTSRELDYLFGAIDYDKDGRISYCDFYRFITPKRILDSSSPSNNNNK